MSSQIEKLTGAWSTDVLPTQTTLTHIDPAAVTGLIETLLSASSAYPTITKNIELYSLARHVKGAQASLSVISAQHYIATATATQDFPLMTQIIWNSTMELQDLEMGFNLYQMQLSLSANTVFAIVFAVLLAAHTGLFMWKKYLYFGVCFFLGTGLELAGYVARVMAIGHYSEKGPFLCQIISLTLAPALIMAGVYYLLAQLLVIYGRRFSRLRPMWFSYIFIFCDISSLGIQAAGGGHAAIKLQNLESTKTGTEVMLSGIAFQVASMTLFVWFLLEFLWKIYFRASPEVTFSVPNFFALLFQTKRGVALQKQYLFQHYNQKYSHIWSRPFFGYYPLAILIGVTFIYIRCVYRLVELHEGWSGYLITHEEFVMTLDGLQVLLTCVLFIPFHPGFVMGKGARVPLHDINEQGATEKGDLSPQGKGLSSGDDHSVSSYGKSEFSNGDDTWDSYSDPKQDLYERPVNPYFIPKIEVAPPLSCSEFSPESPKENASEPDRGVYETNNKLNDGQNGGVRSWRELRHKGWGSVDSDKKHKSSSSSTSSKVPANEHFAIPYEMTIESPQLPQSPQFKAPQIPRKDKKHRRKFSKAEQSIQDTIVNPYTPSMPSEDLETSGPYELYPSYYFEEETSVYGGVESEASTSHGIEVVSSFSDDEFMFTFGRLK